MFITLLVTLRICFLEVLKLFFYLVWRLHSGKKREAARCSTIWRACAWVDGAVPMSFCQCFASFSTRLCWRSWLWNLIWLVALYPRLLTTLFFPLEYHRKVLMKWNLSYFRRCGDTTASSGSPTSFVPYMPRLPWKSTSGLTEGWRVLHAPTNKSLPTAAMHRALCSTCWKHWDVVSCVLSEHNKMLLCLKLFAASDISQHIAPVSLSRTCLFVTLLGC